MSAEIRERPPGARITPGLTVAEPAVDYWISHVFLRLRREICWCWHQRLGASDPGDGTLPPATDAAAENLDLVRFVEERRRFLASDPAARYLTAEIEALAAPPPTPDRQGSWDWVAASLELDGAGQLVLALALAAHADAAFGPVIASCMNDLSRPFPTLALAQRLWDEPLAVARCADPDHPLLRSGLLIRRSESDGLPAWQRALELHGAVARTLLDPGSALPAGLRPMPPGRRRTLDARAQLLLLRLARRPPAAMQVVPLLGPRGSDYGAWAGTLAERTGRRLLAPDDAFTATRFPLSALATVAWLRGSDLLLPAGWPDAAGARPDAARPEGVRPDSGPLAGLEGIPARWYVAVVDRRQLRLFPESARMPPLEIGGTGFAERLVCLREGLGERAEGLAAAIEECARRFRFQELTIERIARVAADAESLDAATLMTLCRSEASNELGALAQAVEPRFEPRELVLPDHQRRQFDEVRRAMRALTEVHYHWGTARVWNESGLSVLLSGPPGTGKTMAAEALARALELPMYRIDLSQVVNKYIGETEKNLKRIFDAGELADCLLFFDEADALFGKRTEVKDAHDRFANIEISYLLERMERFKGLAILATNRRKDLDEAFLRRLRYVIEFPLPGMAQRERIWRQCFPPAVNVSELDFAYLARQFQLSGGNIRSIVFNACLQSAGRQRETADAAQQKIERTVDMTTLLAAVRRELEKMKRTAGREQFGVYGELLAEEAAA